jgi:hypothetical protein
MRLSLIALTACLSLCVITPVMASNHQDNAVQADPPGPAPNLPTGEPMGRDDTRPQDPPGPMPDLPTDEPIDDKPVDEEPADEQDQQYRDETLHAEMSCVAAVDHGGKPILMLYNSGNAPIPKGTIVTWVMPNGTVMITEIKYDGNVPMSIWDVAGYEGGLPAGQYDCNAVLTFPSA